jgi:hypothetical protein
MIHDLIVIAIAVVISSVFAVPIAKRSLRQYGGLKKDYVDWKK